MMANVTAERVGEIQYMYVMNNGCAFSRYNYRMFNYMGMHGMDNSKIILQESILVKTAFF